MSAPRSTDPLDYQAVPRPVAAMAKDFPHGFHIAAHSHTRDQLLYSVSGTMRVHTGREAWIVPPDRAVYIPAHVTHAIDIRGEVAMRTICDAAPRYDFANAVALRAVFGARYSQSGAFLPCDKVVWMPQVPDRGCVTSAFANCTLPTSVDAGTWVATVMDVSDGGGDKLYNAVGAGASVSIGGPPAVSKVDVSLAGTDAVTVAFTGAYFGVNVAKFFEPFLVVNQTTTAAFPMPISCGSPVFVNGSNSALSFTCTPAAAFYWVNRPPLLYLLERTYPFPSPVIVAAQLPLPLAALNFTAEIPWQTELIVSATNTFIANFLVSVRLFDPKTGVSMPCGYGQRAVNLGSFRDGRPLTLLSQDSFSCGVLLIQEALLQTPLGLNLTYFVPPLRGEGLGSNTTFYVPASAISLSILRPIIQA